MNILMLTPAYGKGAAATTQHWTELADYLSLEHRVTILTAYPRSQGDILADHDLKIVPVGTKVLARIANRHLRELMLWICMFFKCCALPERFDLVICVDTPRFAVVIASIRKMRDRARIIVWVMDLPLEQVVRRGDTLQSRRLIAKAANRLYYYSLKLADMVVPVGTCLKDLMIQRGVNRYRIEVIRTWADDGMGEERVASSVARMENGLPDRFTVMYSGYAGAWHEFTPIIEAIPELLEYLSIQFVFAGSGPGIDSISTEKSKQNWDRVFIKGLVSQAQFSSFACCGDIHLTSLKENMLGTCSPSKTYAAMAHARPIIFLGPASCQAALDVRDAKAGEVVGNKEEFIAVINKLFEDRGLLETYGSNARRAFLEKHSASPGLIAWSELIDRMICPH